MKICGFPCKNDVFRDSEQKSEILRFCAKIHEILQNSACHRKLRSLIMDYKKEYTTL